MNAGSGNLTAAVIKAGGETMPPNDPQTGGTDLTDTNQVAKLWKEWVRLRDQGYHLIIHFAPTCTTMSKARQRSWKTKVRSAARPWGIWGLSREVNSKVKAANRLAVATDDLAWRAHTELEADVSVENPDLAFLWELGLFAWPTSTDARFSPCMNGDAISKPTRVRSWGITLPSLKRRCAWFESKKSFSCGRTRANPHVHLSTNKPGEKRMETWQAATYQPGTVKVQAADIVARGREVKQVGSRKGFPRSQR